ncbi:hypothetical protein F1C15_11995 [Frigoribacterium sp. NBH87]|uniref:hypothetical protein n=1 Tax=Frigoribacterium sp. NBH87 TaxID=2596916 RepID=UPI001626A978|nr:hypothetical protein [Frigoribacterium sp. NBH87]QNE44439.1 hypothetical protein F1C15_11995 [Frigoribacterium sp. NBH87]
MDEADRELLRRAEAEVAALPHRDPLIDPPPRLGGGPAPEPEAEPAGRARLLAPLTLILCFVTACAESSWLWFSAADWTTVLWFAVPLLLVASIVFALIAGALGGRAGRWAGICGGVAIVPPVCFVVSLPLALFT